MKMAQNLGAILLIDDTNLFANKNKKTNKIYKMWAANKKVEANGRQFRG